MQNLRGLHALIFHAGEHASIDSRGDGGNCYGEIKRDLRRPLASAFLAGFIEDLVDQWLLGLRIHHAKDLRGDLNQVRLERPAVPLSKGVSQFSRAETESLAQNVI